MKGKAVIEGNPEKDNWVREQFVRAALADTDKAPPMERHVLHKTMLPVMRIRFHGVADILVDSVDRNGMATFRIARYAQPGAHIRKAIKETFG